MTSKWGVIARCPSHTPCHASPISPISLSTEFQPGGRDGGPILLPDILPRHFVPLVRGGDGHFTFRQLDSTRHHSRPHVHRRRAGSVFASLGFCVTTTGRLYKGVYPSVCRSVGDAFAFWPTMSNGLFFFRRRNFCAEPIYDFVFPLSAQAKSRCPWPPKAN